jgi:NAD(P)H-hydrate epimerase
VFLVNAQQMREIDRFTMEVVGIPGVVLMENAGRAVADEVGKMVSAGDRIVVVAGIGNNGGDGVAAARLLAQRNHHVELWMFGNVQKQRDEAAVHTRVLPFYGVDLNIIQLDRPDWMMVLAAADVIVDGLLGTGLKNAVRPEQARIIDEINRSPAKKVAIDIPSGLSADTGKVMGTAVQADVTVTLAAPKKGLFRYPGAEYVGRLIVADIGIPERAFHELGVRQYLITTKTLERLPRRHPNTHKGSYGHLLLVSGSANMTGAPALSASAALRSGVGYLTLATLEQVRFTVSQTVKEAVYFSMGEDWAQSRAQLEHLLQQRERFDVVAIGPGLGRWAGDKDWLREWMTLSQPLVLDADALNMLADEVGMLGKRNGITVLTPHPGEMARLLHVSVKEVEADRDQAALTLAVKYGVYVVLKGRYTVVATPDGQCWLNTSGSPGMAKAGSGDVLTGIITGLLAQPAIETRQAILSAVYIHGLAGEMAAEISDYTPLPSDIIRCLPRAFQQMMV